jgi:hypothetical protein
VFYRFRTFIVSRLPCLVRLLRPFEYLLLSRKSPKHIFTDVFRDNKWKDSESLSGPGSNMLKTQAIRKELPNLIRDLNCASILDVPCGDFFWMKMVQMNIDYIGGDIVDDLIRNNIEQYGSSTRQFIPLNVMEDKLPKTDLIFCRDCLVHFSYKHIFQTLINIKHSGSEFILTTTFINKKSNANITTGAWRPINLERAPFHFPPPIKLIDEECTTGRFRDKCLGLWKTADIPDFGSY